MIKKKKKNQRSLAGEYFKPLRFISCWQLFLKGDFQMEETKLSDKCEMSFTQCVVSRPPACIMKSVVSRRNYWDSSAVPVISDSPRWHSVLTTQASLLPSTYERAVFRYSNSVLSMFAHSLHQTDRSVTTLGCFDPFFVCIRGHTVFLLSVSSSLSHPLPFLLILLITVYAVSS